MRDLSDLMAQRRPDVPTMDNFPPEVGRRLRLQRIAFKWRQADLAARAGVSVQTIKAVEKGQAVSQNCARRCDRGGHTVFSQLT